MWYAFISLWRFIRYLIGLILPVFGKARSYSGKLTTLRWVLHIVLIAAILIGLYFLNSYSGLKDLVTSPLFKPIWLPVLFLLVYVLGWLGWVLWKLLLPGGDEPTFPDIEQAWEEAKQALWEAGINLTDAPLFLVLGRPATSPDALFQASKIALDIKPAPRRRDAPLHVYANRDAIYLTCIGASVLGRHAALLQGTGGSQGSEEINLSESFDTKTLKPGEGPAAVKKINEIIERATKQGRWPDKLTPEEEQELRGLQRQGQNRPALLKDAARVDELTARLEHLCRLVVRDRRPYCPINGILLLLPFAATDGDELAGQTGDIARRDLSAIRKVFRLHCPLLALLCDLETSAGFDEFVSHFSPKERQRRMGQRFPQVPDAPADALPQAIDNMTSWLCNSVLPGFVFKFFRAEKKGGEEREAAVKGNTRLYRFLGEMRERKPRLSRLLTRALLLDASGPLLFGGCYLAGTGSDAERQQAFVSDVFTRLMKEQNIVLWTDEAFANDRGSHRYATWGYIVLILVLLGLVGGAVYHFFWSGGKGTGSDHKYLSQTSWPISDASQKRLDQNASAKRR